MRIPNLEYNMLKFKIKCRNFGNSIILKYRNTEMALWRGGDFEPLGCDHTCKNFQLVYEIILIKVYNFNDV